MRIRMAITVLLFLCSLSVSAQTITGTVLGAEEGHPIVGATVFLAPTGTLTETDESGSFELRNPEKGPQKLSVFKQGYSTLDSLLTGAENHQLTLVLHPLNETLETVVVEDKNEQLELRKLRKVEGTAIYAAKKSEVINIERILANKATNNARQVYKAIAGLNIWESDAAGLQLNIGARGLDPVRTSNFNTRQNGYDISADALGYPESYYTPPTQALKKIEIVRGAASLQYGPQFGGLLNFVFKEASKKKIAFESEQTLGSYGFLSSFNRLSGSLGTWSYNGFYQYKTGNSWRDNSDFEQHNAHLDLGTQIGKRLALKTEYTYMQYLAQQAGGLVDFEFPQLARQSKRNRNWFKVNWNLFALHLDLKLSDKTKLNNRSFFLSAQREALGELGPINRPDPMRERDLIRGKYQNFGNETRLITRYQLLGKMATLVLGTRFYQGYTTNEQGNAGDGSDANFSFLHPEDLEKSSYEFPSRNLSFFFEHLYLLSDRLSITPGARFEIIKTSSDGYYKQRFISGGEVVFEQRFEDQKENQRQLLLLGLGLSYQLSDQLEAYANASQNYRSINFSDLAVVNPNMIIDSLMQDERGYNVDLGLRGKLAKERISFDCSLFLLDYANRIGIAELIIDDPAIGEKAVAYRTNVGDARILGLESYGEYSINAWADVQPKVFTNFSILRGKYLDGSSSIVDNDVELVPPLSAKLGLNLSFRKLAVEYQFSFVGEHFSDATNAVQVADATRGVIPSYSVQDLSASYSWKSLGFSASINNVWDQRYFTRRASGYPGPGIIPAEGRACYFSISCNLE